MTLVTALIAGIMLSFPVIARELYKFVAPGLYKNERQAVLPFLIAIPFLFAIGLALVYFMIMPFVINFALSMERPPQEGQEVAYNLIVFVGDYLALIILDHLIATDHVGPTQAHLATGYQPLEAFGGLFFKITVIDIQFFIKKDLALAQ